MEKKDILIILSGIALLVLIVLAVLFIEKKEPESISILTDRQEYKAGESLRVRIDNKSKETICFSSCYPYYIQKKGAGWESYRYVECPEEDLAEKCVEPKQVKAFELTLPAIEQGPHRLAISACLGCHFQENFKEEQKLYSNQFIVE